MVNKPWLNPRLPMQTQPSQPRPHNNQLSHWSVTTPTTNS